MLKELKHILKTLITKRDFRIHICLDNLGIACNTGKIANSSSQ